MGNVLRLVVLLSVCALLPAGTLPAAPAADAKKLRIGLVYDVGGRGDPSFNDMAYTGLAWFHRQGAERGEPAVQGARGIVSGGCRGRDEVQDWEDRLRGRDEDSADRQVRDRVAARAAEDPGA